MTTSTSDLNLLMVHADDHAPVLADGLAESSARDQQVGGATDEAGHFWDEGGDPNDIELQRWGVIAPQGPEGDRLLALIRPLIEHRQAQQGDAVKVYRVPQRLTQDEAMRWKKREFDSGAELNIEVPRYQLILGDLDQVPLALQQVQASDGYVGRLAFDKEEDYGAYVDKLLRWERAAAGVAKPDSLFFTVHDGTAATAVGHRALVAPGVEVVRRRQQSGQYPANEILEFGDPVTPSPDELLARAAHPDPSVLFTLSHGEGAPRGGWRSPEEQRRRQGAMSFGREGKITGEDLASRTFMPGGVWFMLACYGAGTPDVSAYKHWLEALAAAGQFRGKPEAVLAGLPGPHDRPFTAAVPQAVLANPNGPLAFMGHIDLAWTYSFQELDSGATNRPARYMAITRSILKRDRVGVSMRELLRFFDQTNVELTSLYDQEARERSAGRPVQVDAARRGHLWMLRQDLAEVQEVLRDALAQPPEVAARLVFERGDEPSVLDVGGARILLAHGEHNDPWNRLDYKNLPTSGSSAKYRYPPGSRLVKTLLNPLKRGFGMRFADLLKPDFQGAVLTALAVDPTSMRLIFKGNTATLLWQLFRKSGEGMTFGDGDEGEGNLGIADALDQAGLTPDERAALEASVDDTGAATFADEEVLDGARFKLARAGLKLYAATQRALTGTTGDRYFDLAPDDGEWSEARRLALKFAVNAVVLGHTHSARWKQEPGLTFVNTGTWIHLMRLPSASDGDAAWLGFLDQIRRNPSLDPARGPAVPLVTRFTGLVIHENPAGGALLQLVEWKAGAAPAVLASGAVAARTSAS